MINLHQLTQVVLTPPKDAHPALKLGKPNGWAGMSTPPAYVGCIPSNHKKGAEISAFSLFFKR